MKKATKLTAAALAATLSLSLARLRQQRLHGHCLDLGIRRRCCLPHAGRNQGGRHDQHRRFL